MPIWSGVGRQMSGAERLITVSVKINPIKYQSGAETTLFALALASILSNLTTHLTAPKTPMSGRRTKPSVAMARETVRIQSTCSTQMGFMMENECGAKKQGSFLFTADKIPTKRNRTGKYYQSSNELIEALILAIALTRFRYTKLSEVS